MRIAAVPFLAPFVALLLAGCVARTAVNVATLPVRAGAYGYDKLTTSQAEADRKRGRQLRKEEARDARERKREQQRGATG